MRHGILMAVFGFLALNAAGQPRSGILYSPLPLKTGEFARAAGMGDGAEHFFLADFNGDGCDDALFIHSRGPEAGNVYLSTSDGVFFGPARRQFDMHYQWERTQILTGDFNGDGRCDLIYMDPVAGQAFVSFFSGGLKFPVRVGFAPGMAMENVMAGDVDGDGTSDIVFKSGEGLYVMRGLGDGFATAKRIGGAPGGYVLFTGDATGDGKQDIAAFYPEMGEWRVFASDGVSVRDTGVWKRNFSGVDGNAYRSAFVFDVDRDGKADILLWDGSSWAVCYSDGHSFGQERIWVSGNYPGDGNNNRPPAERALIGVLNGRDAAAVTVSHGKWRALENADGNRSASPEEIDTWEAWGAGYVPLAGRYDVSDAAVADKHIRMIHDAGFDYMVVDLRRGGEMWLSRRAEFIFSRIAAFNAALGEGQHKMYACAGVAFDYQGDLARNLYQKYGDFYYTSDGNPFKFDSGNDGRAEGVATVLPGLCDGMGIFIDREDGERYCREWMKIMENRPSSVLVNSFNGYFDHTAVEPAELDGDKFTADPFIRPWADTHGNPMPGLYWQLTRLYNRLYKYGVLPEGTFYRMYGSPDVYSVTAAGPRKEESVPDMTPVLLLPASLSK